MKLPVLLAVTIAMGPACAWAQSKQDDVRDRLSKARITVFGATPEPLSIPRGYKHAFEDGRLNLKRGERSVGGRAQMQMIWTDDVPMRLIKR